VQRKNYPPLLLLAFLCLCAFFLFLQRPSLPAFFLDDIVSRFSYALHSKEKFSQNIVVVQIDDHTLRDTNEKWPLKRSTYATAIDILGQEGARVVGFDLIFGGEGDTLEEDEAFKAALQRSPSRIVLAFYIKGKKGVFPLKEFREHASLGFINAPRDSDTKVRRLRTFIELDDEPFFSWTAVIASAFYGTTPKKKGDLLGIGPNKIRLDENNDFTISYFLRPKDAATLSLQDLLNRNFPEDYFRDKIVLIGATAEIVHDFVDTPLGVIPGVFSQANGLVTLITGEYSRQLPTALSAFAVTFALAAVLLAIAAFSFFQGLALWLGILLVLFWAGVLLRISGWQFPFGAAALSLISFFLITNLYNYCRFFILLLGIKNQMVIDPFTRLFSLRYFYQRAYLEMKSLPRKKQHLIVIVLDNFSAAMKERTFTEARKIWDALRKSLLEFSGIWSRCSQDSIIGLIPKTINYRGIAQRLRTVLFENNIEARIKIGCVRIQPSCDIRDIVPVVAEKAKASQEQLVIFDALDVSSSIVAKPKADDFIGSLYSDAEERNRDLLRTIEQLINQENKTKEAYLQLVASLVKALESKDPYTEGHSERVCKYALLLARELNLPAPERERIKKAALLHDLGKIGIPDIILHKKEKLSDDEFRLMKEHEVFTVKILEPIEDFKELLPYMLHHHENFDGSGYPHGIAGNFIPLGARIIAVADTYDALITGRDYKRAYSVQEAIDRIIGQKGLKLDPDLVDAFLRALRKSEEVDI
jgi:HD-GYP domain-containing protein (c-di-GMP phosphodiesterase class II)/CHASE2 domain-containing sensor protein